MSKKKRRRGETQAPQTATIAIDTILTQLSSIKDNARASISGVDQEVDEIWKRDIAACEAATAILSALQDEGVQDSEQVRDLVHDYNALAEQYQKMHQQYEEPAKPQPLGKFSICPECHKQIAPKDSFCWHCGKRLGWGR